MFLCLSGSYNQGFKLFEVFLIFKSVHGRYYVETAVQNVLEIWFQCVPMGLHVLKYYIWNKK